MPRVLILRAPGTNCEHETAYAFELAGARPEMIHVNRLVERPARAADFQILCLPGGFSYGDDLGAGRILAGRLRRLSGALAGFRERGGLILGICNGFQVLARTGLLGDDFTLTWNESGTYTDRWVDLAAASDQCVFLRGIDSLYLPIAHAEGNFVARDRDALDALDSAGRLPLRYAPPVAAAVAASVERKAAAAYNPNGSERDVAGVCDETGRVFGLMPHPERHIDPTHHPRWTRGEAGETGDGMAIFRNAVEYFE